MSALAIALACAVGAELFNLVLDTYTWTEHGRAHAGRLRRRARRRRSPSTSPTSPPASPSASRSGPCCCGCSCGCARACTSAGRPDRRSDPPACCRRRPGRASRPPLARLADRAGARGAARAAARPPPGARAASAGPVARAVGYLLRAQNSDGGFGAAPGAASGELYSAWAAIGLAAAGRRPGERAARRTLGARRAALAGGLAAGRRATSSARCSPCARAAPPASCPGGDPGTRLLSYRERDGSFGHLANLTAFAILALRAAGLRRARRPSRAAARWLARQQERDGGFGFASRSRRAAASDVDDTGASDAGARRGARGRGRRGPRRGLPETRAEPRRRRSRSSPAGSPTPSRPRGRCRVSTRPAIDVARVRRGGSPSPLAYLESLRAPTGACATRAPAPDPRVGHRQVLPALAGKPLPVAPPPAGSPPA